MSVLDAEFLLFSLTKLPGVSVYRLAWNLLLLSKVGRWQDSDFCFHWPPEDTATEAKIRYCSENLDPALKAHPSVSCRCALPWEGAPGLKSFAHSLLGVFHGSK